MMDKDLPHLTPPVEPSTGWLVCDDTTKVEMAIRFRDYIKDVKKYVERQEKLITSMREDSDRRRAATEETNSLV